MVTCYVQLVLGFGYSPFVVDFIHLYTLRNNLFLLFIIMCFHIYRYLRRGFVQRELNEHLFCGRQVRAGRVVTKLLRVVQTNVSARGGNATKRFTSFWTFWNLDMQSLLYINMVLDKNLFII